MWKIAKSRLGNLAQNRGKSRSPSWLPGPWVPWVVKYSKILNQGILNDECINPMKGIIRSKNQQLFSKVSISRISSSRVISPLFKASCQQDFHEVSCPRRGEETLMVLEVFQRFFQKTYPSRKVNCIFFVVIAYDLRSQFLLYSPLSGKEPRLERFFFSYFLCFMLWPVFKTPRQRTFSFTGRGICSTTTSVPGAFCHMSWVSLLDKTQWWVCPNGGLQQNTPKKGGDRVNRKPSRHRFLDDVVKQKLAGGFKYFSFSPKHWGRFPFWQHILPRGWNHQLDDVVKPKK